MTHEPVTPGATVPPTRPDPTIRTTAGNSIHPTSRNVERNPATMAMDGPTNDDIPDGHYLVDELDGPRLVPMPPVVQPGPVSPVGRWIAPRGGYVEDRDDAESDAAFTARLNGQLPRPDVAGVPFPAADVGPLVTQAQAEHYRDQLRALNARPVAAVAACPDVLVVACARAQWDAHRVEALKRFPSSRIPEWDDDLGWSMGREWVHGRECDEMRERLAVLWPVIVEHLGWA